MPTVKVDTAALHLRDFIKAVQKTRIIWSHIDDSPIDMVLGLARGYISEQERLHVNVRDNKCVGFKV